MSRAPSRAQRGDFGGNTDSRRPLSEHFAKKAKSDLAMAQAMAKLSTPGRSPALGESGLVLGTCMYLAQQSLEKMLKSTVFRLYETLYGSYDDDGDTDDDMPRSLGHWIYPKTCRRYFALLDSLQATEILRGCKYTDILDNRMVTDTKHRETSLDSLDKLWKEYAKNSKIQNIAWRHSIGMRLEGNDLQTLEHRHKLLAGILTNITCRPGLEITCFSLDRQIPKISPKECLDVHALGRRRKEHSNSAPASGLSTALDREFSECRVGVRDLASSSVHGGSYTRTVQRAILEFGFVLLLYHFKPYTAMFPHNTMGRYPLLLDGVHTTTDLYGRQVEHVMHHLFIGVPHSVSQLSDYSGRISTLWDEISGYRAS